MLLTFGKMSVVGVKPKCLLLFTDLDDTYSPMDIPGMIDFIQVVREIRDKTGVAVKFCPISGRPAAYVLRTLHQARDLLAGAGLHNVCEFGAAEQGALIVDSNKSYGPKFLGLPENRNLKQKVDKILTKSPHFRMISDEPDKLYTCSIHVKNEYKANMGDEEKLQIFSSLRQLIIRELGANRVEMPMSHDCLEVMTKEVSKAAAVQHLIYSYMTTFNVVGIIYAGDSENDAKAIRFVSKLAEIPGVRANVFLPGNASRLIESKYLEKWKNQNPNTTNNRIEKAEERLFRGITALIRKALKEKRLLGPGLVNWCTKDDSCLPNRVISRSIPKTPVTGSIPRIPKEFLLPHKDIRAKQVQTALENLAVVGMFLNDSNSLWCDDKKFLVQAGLMLATIPI